MKVGTPTVDANGVATYPVSSIYQGWTSQTIRVLKPTNPAAGQFPKVLFVLPVDKGVDTTSSTYGDGLEELRLLDVQDQYNMTLIAPSFTYMPWYGDNPGDLTRQMESFIIDDVVPFGDSFVQSSVPQNYLIGFSKSGNGVLFLMLRHPGVFNAGAAWDSPAQMSSLSAVSPDLFINFGTQANYNLYNIPSLVSTNAAPFLSQNRFWISGDDALYSNQMDQLNTQMTTAGILHTWVAATGTPPPHSWNSGWLTGAAAALDQNATLTAPNADTLPPARTGGLPVGALVSGTTQVTLTLNTDDNAICRYATSPGTAYSSMLNTFLTTGGTAHSTPLTGLQDGGNYTYYVRCQDISTGTVNSDDYATSFSVALAPGEPGATASSSFIGTEAPLSENGLWDAPGSWAPLQKNNGAYSANGDSAARLTIPVTDPDQFAEITFDQDPGADSWVGVTARVQGPGNGSSYLARAYNGQVQLYRMDDIDGLDYIWMASASADLSVAPRDLRLESMGNQFRVYFNGVPKINYTDLLNTYPSGQPGIAAGADGGPTVNITSFNGGALPPWAATPTFSVPAGTYTAIQTVTISDATPGATIYYTTDGTAPTTDSSVYSAPIQVSSTETINAIAAGNGSSSSAVASATYTIQLPASFTFTASPNALTMNPGGQGTVALSVTPQNGFNSAVSFSCAGLPAGTSCSFSPSRVTPSGSTAAPSTLTISASTQAFVVPEDSGRRISGLALAGLMCLFGLRRRRSLLFLVLLAVLSAGMLTACGGSVQKTGGGSTPVNAMVTVTARSGAIQQTATVSLTVN